jgi:hypothetical protein
MIETNLRVFVKIALIMLLCGVCSSLMLCISGIEV